ncbi:MAG: hypothetical protein ABSB70_22230 [Candidatus Velthaea sp.]|jgi:hypothetical protein
MPREARIFVKTGLVYLVLTFALGGVLLVLKALGRSVPYVFSVEHAHLGEVGWLVDLVIGIALWMLPLNRERFPVTQGRYPTLAVSTSFVLLNSGLVLRLRAAPWNQLSGNAPVAATLLALAAISQPAAIALFVFVAWQRVRAPRHPAPGVQ